MHRRLLLSAISFGMALCLAGTTWADTPGPPVEQTIGAYDARYAELDETECRVCHDDMATSNPDRHHTAAWLSGKDCLDCHEYEVDENGENVLNVPRNCVPCHGSGDNPHHTGTKAISRQCKSCHGDIVDDYNDGHYIPTYSPSGLVTPHRSLTNEGWVDNGAGNLVKDTGSIGDGTLNQSLVDSSPYASNSTTKLDLISAGNSNDIVIDHTGRNTTGTFNVSIASGDVDNSPTCVWSDDGSDYGLLTIVIEPTVTTAADLVDAINVAEDAGSGLAEQTDLDDLDAELIQKDGGTSEFPADQYNPKGGLPYNSRGNPAGGCNYCHDTDGLAVPIIEDNHDLHHYNGIPDQVDDGTGGGGTMRRCEMCHEYDHGYGPYHDVGGPGFDNAIRRCEQCHGPTSLHSIQADSDGDDDTEVGGELVGYGHVGRDNGVLDTDGDDVPDTLDSDCWGCHGFDVPTAAMSAPNDLVTPTLYNVDPASITAGTDTTVVLNGVGFTNSAGGNTYESYVVLTAADGSTVPLTPDAIAGTTLAVTIPAGTAAGNYNVQAVKGAGHASNPMVLSIVPAVTIASASADGDVTITGSGFGSYAENAGLSVTKEITFGWGRWKQSTTVPGEIVSWSDTEIVADFGGSSVDDVTVNSVFGSASAEVEDVSVPDDGGGNGGGWGNGWGNGWGFGRGNRGGGRGFGFRW